MTPGGPTQPGTAPPRSQPMLIYRFYAGWPQGYQSTCHELALPDDRTACERAQAILLRDVGTREVAVWCQDRFIVHVRAK